MSIITKRKAALFLQALPDQTACILIRPPPFDLEQMIRSLLTMLNSWTANPPQDVVGSFVWLISLASSNLKHSANRLPIEDWRDLVNCVVCLPSLMRDIRVVMAILELLSLHEDLTEGVLVDDLMLVMFVPNYSTNAMGAHYVSHYERVLTYLRTSYFKAIPAIIKGNPYFIFMLFASHFNWVKGLSKWRLEQLMEGPLEYLVKPQPEDANPYSTGVVAPTDRMLNRVVHVLTHRPLDELLPLKFKPPLLNNLIKEAREKKKCEQTTRFPQAVKTFLLCCHRAHRDPRSAANPFEAPDMRRKLFKYMGMFSTPAGLKREYVRRNKLTENYFKV